MGSVSVLDRVEVPGVCREALSKVKERIALITSRYGSLSSYGKPVFESEMEVACVVYLNDVMKVSLEKLSDALGFSDKTALYKLMKRIESQGTFTIWKDNKFTTVSMSKEQLIQLVEGELKARARQFIEDITQSSIMKSFIEAEIRKRKQITGKPSILSEREKRHTINLVKKIMKWMAENGYPTNPDFWTEEMVEKALFNMYGEFKRIRIAMKALRRVPQWSNWFNGRIGAETRFFEPVMRALFFEDWLKIKKLYREGKIPKPMFFMLWLHITCGCREGMSLDGKKIYDWNKARSGLLGLRWENIYYDVDGTPVIKVYESKTERYWDCRLDVIDPEPIQEFLSYRQDKGHIWRTFFPHDSPYSIYETYNAWLAELSKMLGLQFTLEPHDIRRSHISILAEFGADLVSVCSGEFGLGVGWEDLKTAYKFYLRYSKRLKEKVWSQLREGREQLLKALQAS